MAELFNIALSGLNTYRRATSVTGNNVANINTEGYARQTIELSEVQGQGSNGAYIGGGVNLSSVRRMTDDYVLMNYRNSITNFSDFDTYLNKANEVDRFMSDKNLNLTAGMQSFFYALQTACDQPTSVPARQVLLSQTNFLVKRFNEIDKNLKNDLIDTNNKISVLTQQANQYLDAIADLNKKIATSAEVNLAILDERDKVVNSLAKLIGIDTIKQDDGSLNIFTKSGLGLVIGGLSYDLTTLPSSQDPSIKEIGFISNGYAQPINQSDVEGGEMGAVLRYRSEIAFPAIQSLDRLAVGLEYHLNVQHQRGLDLNNNLGGFLFTDVNSTEAMSARAYSLTSNAGTGVVSVAITDPSQLTDDKYQLELIGGTNYELTNLTNNTVTTYTAGLPINVNGCTINLDSGTVAVGDVFIVNPVRYGARDSVLQITDPNELALAAPIRTTTSLQNTGTAVISAGVVTDINNASFATAGTLTPPLKISFITANTYQVLNATTGAVIQAGPIPYTAGQVNDILPLPAMHTSTASGLVIPGSLTPLNAGNLTINGTPIAASLADGVSTTDATASAKAIAATINLGTATHGVTAIVNSNDLNMGGYTAGALVAGQFQINGQNIVPLGNTQQDLLNAISAASGATGVTASVNSLNEIVLSAADGRNIQITTDGTSGATTFANFALTGPADDRVQRGTVSLYQATGNIVVAGANPANGGFTAGTYSSYDPGYRIQISGYPAAGDEFSVNFNTDGRSDNRNGLLMLQLQETKIFNQGESTPSDLFSSLITDIGSKTNNARLSQESAQAGMRQLKEELERISGVNLDEEAANLILYEQAYRASSQLVRTGQTMLDTIFAMMR